MPFEILTDKEIELLSKEEKEYYFLEYKKYQARTKFIDTIERLANVRLDEIKFKRQELKSFPKIAEVKESDFKEPEQEKIKNLKVIIPDTKGKKYIIPEFKNPAVQEVKIPKTIANNYKEPIFNKPFAEEIKIPKSVGKS
ncbi:MAG: hypothetical protein ACI4K5_04785, partial [Ruminococcus sp.]